MTKFKRFDVLGVVALLVTFLSVGCGVGGGGSRTFGASAAGNAHSVDLQWAASPSSNGNYNIYRGLQRGGPYQLIHQIVAPGSADKLFTDDTVQRGQTYYYVVTAVDPNGVESNFSNEVTAQIPNN